MEKKKFIKIWGDGDFNVIEFEDYLKEQGTDICYLQDSDREALEELGVYYKIMELTFDEYIREVHEDLIDYDQSKCVDIQEVK